MQTIFKLSFNAADLQEPKRMPSAPKVTIFHNPQCGTSRNVLALIRNAGIEPDIIEYLKTPPTREELQELIAQMGVPVLDVVRQKEAVYQELGLDGQGDDALLDAMLAHPVLINRPIVVTPLATRLCRPSEAVLDILPLPQRGAFSKEDGEQVINERGERVAGR
jgi:arsenate reductase (glutaredoxin)